MAAKRATVVEAEDLDVEDNPVETGLVLANPSNGVSAPSKLTVRNYFRAVQPMVVYGGGAVVGFVGANWFRGTVTARFLNATWKTATPMQGLIVDVLLQLLIAWQIGRRFKGFGRALAAGIVVNAALAAGKAMTAKPGQPSRFDVVIFTPNGNGGAPPAPAPAQIPANGQAPAQPLGAILPSRRMAGIQPARR